MSEVATREGGVDRNNDTDTNTASDRWSPPVRVAWIEIAKKQNECTNNRGRHP